MKIYFIVLLLTLLFWCGSGSTVDVVTSNPKESYICPPAALKEPPYPEWAHHHWVWLSNDRANQSSMMKYAQEYLDHNISVGAVDIDSGWSTGFNNFIFNNKKYPNATEMVEYFHAKKIRIILWATSMIDTDSSNYQEAHSKGYLLRNGLDQQAIISWWHGKGGLLDYTNPEALKWWHEQMDNVLSLGIDGWKCDGTDPYVYELVVARGKGGVVSRKDYSDAYYGDFFDYTREKLGKDRLIMSRPVDGFDFLFLDYSPRRVVLSGWVGDNDPTFDGMEKALKSYLQSAWAGYPNFGSDIGGYRSGGNSSLGRTKELLIRWAQLGAFSPLMENGGNKEHRPWMFDNETLTIYKQFVDIHYQLIPYLLTTGSKALESGKSSITPIADHSNFVDKLIDDFKPSTYNYLLGDQLLVAPMYQAGQASVSIDFPSPLNGSSSWVYWFDHKIVEPAKSSKNFKIPLNEFGVFIATDSILPLRITTNSSNPTISPATNSIRWFLYLSEPPIAVHTEDNASGLDNIHTTQSFHMREENGSGLIASWKWQQTKSIPLLSHSTGSCIQLNVSAHSTLRSLVQVETSSFDSIYHVQEIMTPAGGYEPLPMFTSEMDMRLPTGGNEGKRMGRATYGAVITKTDSLLSVLIYPIGRIEEGHSFIICF